MKLKEKLPLIVGIGLPLLLIAYIFASVYLPSFFIKPKYNFIYQTCNGQDYAYETYVRNQRIVITRNQNVNQGIREIPLDNFHCFYLYDVVNDNTKPVTISEAQGYRLDPSSKSPDGFRIASNDDTSDGGFFPFFWYSGGDSRGYYLRGNGLNKKMSNYNYSSKFLGWVLQ